jgi:hypothetical protein
LDRAFLKVAHYRVAAPEMNRVPPSQKPGFKGRHGDDVGLQVGKRSASHPGIAPVFDFDSALLVLVACAACVLPAWRASRVAPVLALKSD